MSGIGIKYISYFIPMPDMLLENYHTKTLSIDVSVLIIQYQTVDTNTCIGGLKFMALCTKALIFRLQFVIVFSIGTGISVTLFIMAY